VKREILLLLLRCLSTEPELCPDAVAATARDPEARRFAEALMSGTASLAFRAPDAAPPPASAAPMPRASRR
jgi:hypothetical protein